MHKKLLAIIFSAIFLSSCANKADDRYSLSNTLEMRELEKQDHKICAALKFNFDRKDNFLNRNYWQCRISFAKYRLSTGRNATPEQLRRDAEVKDLIVKISLKITATPESVIIRENQKIDGRDHNRCLAMGFDLDTEDQAKIEDYFSCRKFLLDDQQLIPPYGNLDYLQFQNRSYNIGFIIDQRVSKEIARYNELQGKYPSCVSYNIRSLNFKRCTEAVENSRKCFEGIPKKKFRLEGEEKVACQQRAYLKFGDILMKKDDQKSQDIARSTRNSDYYNKQNFASLGIDETKFYDKKNEDLKKGSVEKINPKAGLYEKFELTKLRQRFVIACQKDAAIRVENYVSELRNSCEAAEKFEVVEEE
ncbi:MAG: hypothetical protein KGP29_02130 [Proteobacteria bacterium]|nr:hypothetical protein [Pseudomonadota bacterium]